MSAHEVTGTYHTVAGLTTGHLLTATGTNTFAWTTKPVGALAVYSMADITPASPTAYDDEFEATSINTALWTLTTVGTPTMDYGTKFPSWVHMITTTTAGSVSLRQAAPAASTDLNITAKFTLGAAGQYSAAQLQYHSTNGHLFYFSCAVADANGTMDIGHGYYNGLWTTVTDKTLTREYTRIIYLHLQRDTSNDWLGWFSHDGIAWVQAWTPAQAFNSGTPDYIDVSLAIDQTRCSGGIDWFRRDWITL